MAMAIFKNIKAATKAVEKLSNLALTSLEVNLSPIFCAVRQI